MLYTLYQIDLYPIHDQINAKGWDKAKQDHPEVAAHLAVSLGGSQAFTADLFKHYRPVAIIDATDLDDAFAISNGAKQGRITATYPRVRSASVGDIFRTDTGCHMIDSFGFQEIRLTGAPA